MPSASFQRNLSEAINTRHRSHRQSHRELSRSSCSKRHRRRTHFDGNRWLHSRCDGVSFLLFRNIRHSPGHGLCSHQMRDGYRRRVEVRRMSHFVVAGSVREVPYLVSVDTWRGAQET